MPEGMSVFICLLLTATCLAAGFVQGLVGFAMAMVALSVLPFFMPLTQAAALVGAICVPMNAWAAWTWRRGLDVRRTLAVSLFYIAAAALAIRHVAAIPTRTLSLAFGLFMVALALYFMVSGSRLRIRPGLAAALVCGAASGLCDGFFGIGGPFLVIYYLASTDSREAYYADIQFTFVVVTFAETLLRIRAGLLTSDMAPALVLGVAMALLGISLGMKLARRVDDGLLRRLIYLVIGTSGLITILKTLL